MASDVGARETIDSAFIMARAIQIVFGIGKVAEERFWWGWESGSNIRGASTREARFRFLYCPTPMKGESLWILEEQRQESE